MSALASRRSFISHRLSGVAVLRVSDDSSLKLAELSLLPRWGLKGRDTFAWLAERRFHFQPRTIGRCGNRTDRWSRACHPAKRSSSGHFLAGGATSGQRSMRSLRKG